MTYFASCGHGSDIDDVVDFAIKDYTTDCRAAVRYASMCTKCAAKVADESVVISWDE